MVAPVGAAAGAIVAGERYRDVVASARDGARFRVS
jgi:hypothetical protein